MPGEEPSAYNCPDPKIAGGLGRIEFMISELTHDVTAIVKEVREANHRTTKIEAELLTIEIKATEREKWAKERAELLETNAQEKADLIRKQLEAESTRRDKALADESVKRDKQNQNQKWFIGTIITATAVAAGIADKVASWLI